MELKPIKWIKKTYYDIISWYYFNSPIYINLNIWNTIKLYIKNRNIFIAPQIVKHKLTKDDSLGSDYFYLSVKSYHKWFEFDCVELGYKSKWGSLRFESVPYITICLMNKVRWVWGLESTLWESTFNSNGSNLYFRKNNDLYWETILYYTYNNKDIIKTFKSNIWVRPIWDNINDTTITKLCDIPITSFNMFKNKYKTQIANILESQRNTKE